MEDKRGYYNQELFWETDLFEKEKDRERINYIINNLPNDIYTLLDVGCGNGSVINRIQNMKKMERIVGVDFSATALKYVKTEKYLMSISKLDFQNNEFDIVICNEVLEHLTQQEFHNAVLEISRVAKKYILITVPNEDDLESMLCNCPSCKCWYNPEYHVRKFDKGSLKKLFEDYSCTIKDISEESVIVLNSIGVLYYIYYKNPRPPSYGVCPQCGYQEADLQLINENRINNKMKYNKIIFKILNVLMGYFGRSRKKKSRWLLAIYKKQTNSDE